MFPTFIAKGTETGKGQKNVKKKVLTMIMAGAMIVGLTACGNDDLKEESSPEITIQTETTQADTTEEITTETTTEEVTTEAVLTTQSEAKSVGEKENAGDSISKEQAEKLLEDTLGTEDEQTGNTYSFGYEDTVTVDGANYHVFEWSWLVDNDHLSRLTELFVRADGKAIYEGLYNETGSQIFTEKNYLGE